MAVEGNEYNLDHVDDGNPVMQQVMQATVQQLTVEFLDQGALKPHVIFKVNFTEPVVYERSTFRGCRLSMEYVGGRDNFFGGFQIKPVNYFDETQVAQAAFRFQISPDPRQVGDYIRLFRGEIGNNGGDLTEFDFVKPNPMSDELDGCRDFITQCFIRLYDNGMVVAWEAIAVVKGRFDPGSLHSYHFHDLIGNKYTTARNRATVVEPLPLHRGTFHGGFQRIENYHGCALPYVAQTQAPEPAAASSGYPAGGVSYAGPISSTSQYGYQDNYSDNYQGVPSSSTSQPEYETTPDYPNQSSYTSQPGYQTTPYSQYPNSSSSQPGYQTTPDYPYQSSYTSQPVIQDSYDSYHQGYSSSSTSQPGYQDNYNAYYQGDPSSSTSQPEYQPTPEYPDQSSSGAGRTDRSSRRERQHGRRRR